MTLLERPTADVAVPRTRAAATRPVVVATAAAGHDLRHLSRETGPRPRRVAAALDPAWVRGHDFDLLHVHAGVHDVAPARLREVVGALADAGRPLVLTAVDLRDPASADRSGHDARLDVLVPAATEVVAPTPGAAAEVERRWGRTARVVPHPHVVDLRTMAVAQDCRARRRGGPFLVGLHLAAAEHAHPVVARHALEVLPALVDTVAALPAAVLRVEVTRDLLDGAPRLSAYLHRVWDGCAVDVGVHDAPVEGPALWQELAALDVAVLPDRTATHSVRLEACRDLGTTVVAPSCGHLAGQGPVLTYVRDEHRFEPGTLAEAVAAAHAGRPRLGASVDERRLQRAEIARALDDVYAAALAR